jgi:type IV pilus assembly protein PilA
MSKNSLRSQRGFSFIEVLVVGAIFGILALIAIPQYSMYRARSFNTAAATDLRNVAAAEEKLFAERGHYLSITSCSKVDANSNCVIEGLPGVSSLSRGVNLKIEADGAGFQGEARHAKSASVCSWDSRQGGMLGCVK